MNSSVGITLRIFTKVSLYHNLRLFTLLGRFSTHSVHLPFRFP